MLRQLLCLSLACLTSLAAEQIDDIEFELPSNQNWKIEEDITNSSGTVHLYMPDNDSDDIYEVFSAQIFKTSFCDQDLRDFGDWLKISFPFYEFTHNLIESNEDSTTMEVFSYDEKDFELYILIRKIRSENGVVFLTYSTDNEAEIETIRSQWIPMILNAKAQIK